MAGIIHHPAETRFAGSTPADAYMAHITVRLNERGARRVTHEYYADDIQDLWNHAIQFLHEGFSVISVEMYTCE